MLQENLIFSCYLLRKKRRQFPGYLQSLLASESIIIESLKEPGHYVRQFIYIASAGKECVAISLFKFEFISEYSKLMSYKTVLICFNEQLSSINFFSAVQIEEVNKKNVFNFKVFISLKKVIKTLFTKLIYYFW